METVIKHVFATPDTLVIKQQPLWNRFISWSIGQEKNRFAWLAVALAGHGCFLTPLTLFAIILSGNLFVLWIIAMAAMAMCLITNLAALPTKITIPVFLLSIFLDLLVITYCAIAGFDISGTYI